MTFDSVESYKKCCSQLKKNLKTKEKKIQKLSKQLNSLDAQIMAQELQKDNKAVEIHDELSKIEIEERQMQQKINKITSMIEE